MSKLTFKRHITESLRNLKRNGWMTTAAIAAVTVTLLLVGGLLSVLLNVNKIANDVQNDVEVRVFIDRKTTAIQQQDLKNKLAKIDGVQSISYSSRKKELNNVVGAYGKEFRLFSGDENPLYDVYVVKTNEPKDTINVAKTARNYQHVYQAQYGGASAKKLFNIVSGIRRWGVIISILLLFVAVFLISNTIRLTILSREDEISIMRLVGATNSYIRWPFILEGAWTGFFGSIIPILLVDFSYGWTYNVISQSLRNTNMSLLTPHTFLVEIDFLLALIGIGIGALGAGLSMSRFLKLKN